MYYSKSINKVYDQKEALFRGSKLKEPDNELRHKYKLFTKPSQIYTFNKSFYPSQQSYETNPRSYPSGSQKHLSNS